MNVDNQDDIQSIVGTNRTKNVNETDFLIENKVLKIEQLVIQNNLYLQEIKELRNMVEFYRIRYISGSNSIILDEINRPIKYTKEELRNEIAEIKTSTSLYLGRLLVHSIKKPGINILLLPIRLIIFPFRKKPDKQLIYQTLQTVGFNELKEHLLALQNSESYRLGQILVFSIKNPGKNTILLPIRLLQFLYTLIFKNKKIE